MLLVWHAPFLAQLPDDVADVGFAALVRQTRPLDVIVQVEFLPCTVRTWPTVEHLVTPNGRPTARLVAAGDAASAATTATTRMGPVLIGGTVPKRARQSR